jgi:TP901 family phage tail tape measure protein
MAGLELIAKFSVDTSGLKKGVDDATKRMKQLEAEDKKIQKAREARRAQSMKALKQFGVIAVGTAIAVGVKAVKAFAAFEKGMAEVGTLTNFSSKQMRQMSQETLKLTAKFGQTTEVMTKARYDIVSAGFADITEQTQLLTKANELAIAGVTDVSVATDALTSVINAYGKEVITAEQASDVLFGTVRQGKTTIDELAPAIGKVLPTAAAAGVAFDEIGASLATLTAAGISTPQAVTALNSAIFALSAPTKQAANEMERMGINATNAEGQMLPLVDVFGQFEGLSLEEIRKVIPDKEAAKAILAAANNMDIFRANTEALQNVAGVTQEAFAEMADTAAFKFSQLDASLDTLTVTFGAFLASIETGPLAVNNIITTLNDWQRLLTIDEKGVSNLRKEWQMFLDTPLAGLDHMIGKANQFGAVLSKAELQVLGMAEAIEFIEKVEAGAFKEAEQNVKGFGNTAEKVFVKNQKAAQETAAIIISETDAIVKNTSMQFSQAELDFLAAETAKQKALMDTGKVAENNAIDFSSKISNAASTASAAITDDISSANSEISSSFSDTIGDMVSSGGQLGGAADSLPPGMSSATNRAGVIFRTWIGGLPRTHEVRVTLKMPPGGIPGAVGPAGGGLITGFGWKGITGYASGGSVTDTVPAMLTPGEFVVRRSSVKGNEKALRKLNQTGHFAQGGMVQNFQAGGAVAGAGALGAGAPQIGALTAFGLTATAESLEQQLEMEREANERRLEAQIARCSA